MTLKSIFFNNFGLKLTALLFALTVWIIVSGQEHAYLEKNFEANVEFLNAAENIDATPRPEKVRIKVKSTSKEIKNISPDDFKLKIDLSGITQNTTLTLLAADFIELPPNIKPEEVTIQPRMIAVAIQELIWKEVDVKVHFIGEKRPGADITTKIIPGKIMIYGYKSQIEDIDAVYAIENINLDEITENKALKMRLQKTKDILRFDSSETIEVQLRTKTVDNKKKDG
jgi:YbbR domain-containing protein